MLRDYELLLVIRPSLDEAGAVDVARQTAELIQRYEGTLTSTNVWGRRKLAYPIENQVEATYILLKFKITPASLTNLEFSFRLNESLLRYLIVKDVRPAVTELQESAVEEVTSATDAAEAAAETAETEEAPSPAETVADEAVAEEAS